MPLKTHCVLFCECTSRWLYLCECLSRTRNIQNYSIRQPELQRLYSLVHTKSSNVFPPQKGAFKLEMSFRSWREKFRIKVKRQPFLSLSAHLHSPASLRSFRVCKRATYCYCTFKSIYHKHFLWLSEHTVLLVTLIKIVALPFLKCLTIFYIWADSFSYFTMK